VTTPPERVRIEVPRWVASLTDPGVRWALALLGVALAGFVGIVLAWRGVAARLYVSLQLPFVVSAAFGGAALAAAAVVLLAIHLDRRDRATHRGEVDELVRAAAAVAEAIRRRRVPAGELVLLRRTVHRRGCRILAGRGDARPLPAGPDAPVRSCRICRPSGLL
jgi:hypothetical protein